MNPKAIQAVQHCTTMPEVRRCVDALDDILVPLLVQRTAYMTQAARIKQDVNHVRDEARIQTIVDGWRVAGIRSSGNESKVLLNERVYKLNDIVDRTNGLRLTKIASDQLTFTTADGIDYVKTF